MDEVQLAGADRMRGLLSSQRPTPAAFHAALTQVPSAVRDAWVDRVLGLDELPDDGPELPRGCVPYLPSSVDALLRVVEHAAVEVGDVFVDIGSGLGRATALVHLVTGAGAIGIEIQPALVRSARELAARIDASRVSVIEGDAACVISQVAIGSVFFLYCPFGGERLTRLLDELAAIARTHPIRVCCLGLPLPPLPWLAPVWALDDLAIYRST